VGILRERVVPWFTERSLTDAREVRRVLKPGGLYLFLEHGLSREASTATWQRRITRLRRRLGMCSFALPVDALIQSAGFELRELHRYTRPKAPGLAAETYEGVAAPGAQGKETE
jgi:hypothetical protein